MFLQLTFLSLLCAFNVVHLQSCDDKGGLVYQEIGCTPLTKSGEQCPYAYDCKHYKEENGCKFRGQVYGANENIPGTIGCNLACICNEDLESKEKRRFHPICAMPGCYYPQQEGCHVVHAIQGCCFLDLECDQNAPTCTMDEVTVKRGELFSPNNTCHSCVCKDGFRGIVEEPHCVRTRCDVELYHSYNIIDKCAMVFPELDAPKLCCPYNFICPTSADVTNVITSKLTTKCEEKCYFGNKAYGINTTMTISYAEGGKYKCKCLLPPLLACQGI